LRPTRSVEMILGVWERHARRNPLSMSGSSGSSPFEAKETEYGAVKLIWCFLSCTHNRHKKDVVPAFQSAFEAAYFTYQSAVYRDYAFGLDGRARCLKDCVLEDLSVSGCEIIQQVSKHSCLLYFDLPRLPAVN
jgi:hypothetical protein